MAKAKSETDKIAAQHQFSTLEKPLEVGDNRKQLFIGIPKETSYQEKRISLTPKAAALLVNNGHEVVVETKAGIVLSNGDVVDAATGVALTFSAASSATAYYVIVRHRNHLPIASPAAASGGTITVDFTTTTGTPPGSFTPMVDVGGVWAMYAGNVNGDGFVNASDYTIWKSENAQFFQYLGGDINLDQFVNAADFVIWKTNNSKFS